MTKFGTGAHSPLWRLAIADRSQDPVYLREDSSVGIVVKPNPWKAEFDTDNLIAVAYGDPEVAIAELTSVTAKYPVLDRVMVSQEIHDALPSEMKDSLGPYWGFAWDFFWADAPLESVAHSDRVELIKRDTPELAALKEDIRSALELSNPITHTLKHMHDFDWFIMRNDAGHIVTVMAAELGEVTHLHGLGTIPAYRGRGYGGTTMVGAINLALQQGSYIQFGVWTWNKGARRLYERLGIAHGGVMISASKEPFEDLEHAQ